MGGGAGGNRPMQGIVVEIYDSAASSLDGLGLVQLSLANHLQLGLCDGMPTHICLTWARILTL